MADKRIHNLTDEQANYDPDIYVAVDDTTFTNTRKMPVSAIFDKTFNLDEAGTINASSVVLRLDDGSGTETKMTIQDLLENASVINVIKALGSTGWKQYGTGADDIILNSAKVVANTLTLYAISVLGMVTITGKFDTTSQPATDETLFTLPASIPTCSRNIYFGAIDSQAAGGEDENYELYIPAGTRTIKNHIAGSSGNEAVFSVTFPAI